MYAANESIRATARGSTDRAAAGARQAGDPALFTRELLERLAARPAEPGKIAAAMEKLASAIPGASVSNRPGLASFAGAGTYFVATGADSTANISPELLSAMADDEPLFNRVRDMVESLLQAGREQGLVGGGGRTSRNVAVSAGEARYVEVQRDARGRAVSISSLLFETRKSADNALDSLMDGRRTGAATGFSALAGGSAAWRLESMFTADSSAMQTLAARQNQITRLDAVIVGMEMEARGSTGPDFLSVLGMSGLADPLVLDLGGDGIDLSAAEDGVHFDMLGDGTRVRTAWIRGDDAFLYLDADGNGLADDANELFGEHGGRVNGFAKLAEHDANGDGAIDADDPVFADLRLWRDLNGDGVNQAEESLTLAQAGVASINLRHDNHRSFDANGNLLGERSTFTRTDGSRGGVSDVWLRHL